MKTFGLGQLAATTAISLVMGIPAHAMAADAPPASTTRVEEVVVTAQRRAENIQDTPISISAITAKTLQDAGIKRVEDFANLLPNVYIDQGNLRTQEIAIRGLTADLNNPGLDQSVGIFVDGVYMGRAATGNSNLFDLERVEVLRGPQGTLYGKNTIAGAINYISRLPSDQFYAEGDLSYGNYNAVAGNAVVSGPIASNVFASIAASVDNRDGFIDNLATGTKEDNNNETAGRIQLVFAPRDNLQVILRADASTDRTHDGVSEVTNNGVLTGSPVAQPPPNSLTVAQNLNSVQNRDAWGVSGEVNWKTYAGTLTSITAYRGFRWYNLGDNDFTILDDLASGIKENQRQFSQELRFASKSGARFDYVAGLYYFNQRDDTDSDALIGKGLGIYPTDVNAHILGLLNTNSYAAFAHADYHFTDKLSLSGGVRFTQEDKSVIQSQIGDPFGVLLKTQAARRISRNESNASPNVSLNYKLQENVLLYATLSQGYKSGGFNVFSITPTSNAEYLPEKVTNYEAGFKSEFFDHRLRFNVSAFLMDYRNLQVNQLLLIGGLPAFQTSNAAKARSEGVEVELAARVTPEFQLMATYGYDDAYYASYAHATSTNRDYTGNTLPRAPKNNASLVGEWTHPLADGLSLLARGEYSYRSKVFFGPDNGLFQGDLDLINARLGVQSDKGRWGVYLWGRNLTDRRYAVDKEFGVIIPGQVTEELALPRTFGIEITGRY